MSRFFGVPLLIISIVVAGSILVVFLFGGPAAPQSRTIDELLDELESGTGTRSAGVLLPREKQLWQMALELSLRLEKKDKEFTSEQLAATTRRLATMVEQQIVNQVDDDDDVSPNLAATKARRLEFLIHALGRTEQSEAIPPLLKIVESRKEPYLAAAVQELGNLHDLPEARASAGEIAMLLSQPLRPESAMVAATALSVLAPSGDEQAIRALKSLMHSREGEISWSAAMALARLGDSAGRLTLLDLLDRTFWESGERFEVKDEKGNLRRYPMPPQRIEQLLMAAIDASSKLPDAALWDAIKSLESDPSPSVRRKATEALSNRSAPVAGG